MVSLVPSNILKPSSNFLIDLSKAVLVLCNLFCVCLCHTVLSVPFSLVATCWVLLAIYYMRFSCVFVTYPYGALGQVWYLIVSISDICLLPFFYSFLQGAFRKKYNNMQMHK